MTNEMWEQSSHPFVVIHNHRQVTLHRSRIYRGVTCSTVITATEHSSDIKLTKHTPEFAREHWGVCWDNLGGNWQRYDDILLYSLGRPWKIKSLQWRHNERDGVSNHQLDDCLLKRLFRPRSKKTSKLCVTDLCAGKCFHLMTSSCEMVITFLRS